MNFEVGKYYKRRDGIKAKCISVNCPGRYLFVFHSMADDSIWRAYENGGIYSNGMSSLDIVSPWVEPLDFDWSHPAAWCHWIAMDGSGAWFAYGEEPGMDDGFWTGRCDRIPIRYAPKNFVGDWKDSLFERPKV